MKFNFKIPTNIKQIAVRSRLLKCFRDREYHDKLRYVRDLGNAENGCIISAGVLLCSCGIQMIRGTTPGYKNEAVELTDAQPAAQYSEDFRARINIKQSSSL